MVVDLVVRQATIFHKECNLPHPTQTIHPFTINIIRNTVVIIIINLFPSSTLGILGNHKFST